MTEERFERMAALVLAAGVAVSATLVAAGFAASFVVGWTGSLSGAPTAPTDTADFSGLLARLVVLQPLAIVQAGLVVLVATPVLRVAVTAFGFWREHDRLYVGLALAVLALLAVSFTLLRLATKDGGRAAVGRRRRGKRRRVWRLDAALGHGHPVGLVEDDLAQVPEAVGSRRLGRMVVVEPQQGALPVADLEEAHHATGVAAFLHGRLVPLDLGTMRSATTGASKCAVEPAFESGRSVASPRA